MGLCNLLQNSKLSKNILFYIKFVHLLKDFAGCTLYKLFNDVILDKTITPVSALGSQTNEQNVFILFAIVLKQGDGNGSF